MLSDHERRELSLIEKELETDPRLAASLGDVSRRRRRLIRLLVVLGALLIVIGVLTSAGGLVLQGLLAAGAGVAWSRWGAWRARKARRSAG